MIENNLAGTSREQYWDPYVGGFFLGIVLFLAFYLTGNGLGASGALNRVQVLFVDLIAPDHVDRVAYLAQMAGGQTSALMDTGVFMLLGTFIGGLLSGWFHKRVKLETRKGPRIGIKTRWFLALLGGTIMGYGARLARGCTSGQALTGGAVLSVGSWVFMMCVFAGGYLLAGLFRKLWN